MPRPPIAQQTSTMLPLHGELARAAPQPQALAGHAFAGPLQWSLEGPGWRVLRPAVDLVFLCSAVIVAIAPHRVLYPSVVLAPLLALPLLVILLFYLRGLYRTRLRALVLD